MALLTVFGYFDLQFLLFITIKCYMKTALKIANHLINENILHLKVSSLRYLGMINLCQSTHFTYTILQYTCFNFDLLHLLIY